MSFHVSLLPLVLAWYAKERSLGIHLIRTRRREAFYWVAILLTFSLGTAFGEFITEDCGLGYGKGVTLFTGVIVALTAAARFFSIRMEFCAFGLHTCSPDPSAPTLVMA